MDISLLSKIPEPAEEVTFCIELLAPISMVSEAPGSFYKTLRHPDKQILCGLFENILGWHFSREDRTAIIKDVEKKRKEQKLPFSKITSRSAFLPLLMEYFELEKVEIHAADESLFFYNDLWKRAYRRKDSGKTHSGGTLNIDYSLVIDKHIKYQNEGLNKDAFLLENIDKVSYFYTTPTNREYLTFNGEYHCMMKMDKVLVGLLESALEQANNGYLGNSEGWVSMNLLKSKQ